MVDPKQINIKVLEYVIGLNLDNDNIITNLNINDKNTNLHGTKYSLCSYLIQELQFMNNEVQNKIDTSGIQGYEFYYSQYDTRLNNKAGLINPGNYDILVLQRPPNYSGVHDKNWFKDKSGSQLEIYPEDFDSQPNPFGLPNKFNRSIYENMCDIIRVYAEYKDNRQTETFLDSTEYIDALYTSDISKDTNGIHTKFTEKTLEFCTKYRSELDLFDLCGDIVKYLRHPYPVPKSLYTDVYNDLKQMKKNFEDLYAKKKKKPINLYEVIHRSF